MTTSRKTRKTRWAEEDEESEAEDDDIEWGCGIGDDRSKIHENNTIRKNDAKHELAARCSRMLCET